MTYRTPRVSELTIVAVAGAIDRSAVRALERRIEVALGVGRTVVVHVCAVTALGGETIDLLCAALRRVNRRGARLTIVGGQPALDHAIERCTIHGVEVHPTLAAAITAATGASSRRPSPALATGDPSPCH